jgi:putative IMPACT (imprinted ancient) family translation regulator
VLVTRYFGGIKLGTGGLSRAYYDCAKAGLEKVNKVKLIDYKTIKLTADIRDISVVYHAINTINLVKLNELFNADNTVTVLANADIANIVEIEKELTKICKGKVKFVF